MTRGSVSSMALSVDEKQRGRYSFVDFANSSRSAASEISASSALGTTVGRARHSVVREMALLMAVENAAPDARRSRRMIALQ